MIEPPLRPNGDEKVAYRPVLVILHQATSSPGRVGILLREMGFPLDIRRPPLGDALPSTLEGHAGAVVFGGPMSANDNEEFIRRETDWLAVPLSEGRPFLGLCLGAQMLVNHLGGRVHPHAEGRAEYGWYDLEPTSDGSSYIADWPAKVLQFHKEGVVLPTGATLLAKGEDHFPNQAFAVGPKAIGVQFHPELTAVMLHRWVVKAHERFQMPGAQSARESLQGRLIHDAPLRQFAVTLLQRLFIEAEA
ncbi:glutamine amidotransferase [Notoacmeibacter sp. MSK16QG-6]|uniref:glutamine amidotransferase n=1 Tax=Notoacmeibacter sp. MSK16QG-6 TaxID=2957982 RepID=UPI00209EBEF5|nr:glutamine amidotransferase [Notoacmeibacter sp. MSK16QG-6]MCP1199243.1 glutamine amidotransferase [Notoacmeibacter sp. MSK16QG-6]